MSELTREERAVLFYWSGKLRAKDAPPEYYPKGFAAEDAVMKALCKKGLFRIVEVEDPDYGPMVSMSVTDAGRALVNQRHPIEKGDAPSSPPQKKRKRDE